MVVDYREEYYRLLYERERVLRGLVEDAERSGLYGVDAESFRSAMKAVRKGEEEGS